MFRCLLRSFTSKLYTWGSSPSSLGHQTSATTTSIPLPKLIEVDEPITKCVLGPNHSAVVTEKGSIYTFGSGSYGALGHDDEEKAIFPKKIESLSKLEIAVKDVAIGSYHTVILSTEGEVWTMGYGGVLSGGFWRNLISQSGGGLGHGDMLDKFVPSVIVSLKEHEDISQIAAGAYHTIALGASGNLYSWGKGEMGVLGTGKNQNIFSPMQNPFILDLLEQGIKTVKIAACNYCNMILLDNGKVAVWGWNEVGQLALGNFARADMYDIERVPTEIPFFVDMKIKDFCLGEDCSVFLTQDNRVFFAGTRLYREPKELAVPKGVNVKKIFAVKKAGGYITGIF